MSQIELSEQDLEKVDKLVKNGLFINRNQVIMSGLESLSEISEDEVRKMKDAQAKVNSYLEINVGNLLSAGCQSRL